ncbi:MAG: alpha-amylase family glycosyl hydrolase [Verrucomicrobiota bacterium]|nr:alpha-amylase family glycosyl hydrolase [Verrucomicrobiota bacterium]
MKNVGTLEMFGPVIRSEGVEFRARVEGAQMVTVIVCDSEQKPLRTIETRSVEGSVFSGIDEEGKAGDLYLYSIDGRPPIPDLYSQYQPFGSNGPSMVVDSAYPWRDADYKTRSLREIVVYEMHVGAFSNAGTFHKVIERLPYFQSMGINCLALMPVAEWSGRWNWGYDPCFYFAPFHGYGHPDTLRKLIDTAHMHGISVFLECAFGHTGPGGVFSAFDRSLIEPRSVEDWLQKFNLSSPATKDFIIQNIVYWLDLFHADGVRVDVHPFQENESARSILKTAAQMAAARGKWIVGCTDEATAVDGSGMAMSSPLIQIGNRELQGGGAPIVNRWPEQIASSMNGNTGIKYISNHDLIGNRPFGGRINFKVVPESYRALSALLCLGPQTPMLFMGQEFATQTPFLFFTDHEPTAARSVRSSRKAEYIQHGLDADLTNLLPDPQDPVHFEVSKLDWAEIYKEPQRGVLLLYKECLNLRRDLPVFRPPLNSHFKVTVLNEGIIALFYTAQGGTPAHLVLCDLTGNHTMSLTDITGIEATTKWGLVLSTNDKRFGGLAEDIFDSTEQTLRFRDPETLIFRAVA